MKNKWFWIIGLVLVCTVVCAAFVLHQPEASAAESRIAQTLELLGAPTAVLTQEASLVEYYQSTGLNCEIYQSEENGYRYIFDAAAGNLVSIQILPEKEQEETSSPNLAAEKLRALAVKSAAAVLKDALIGELRLVGESDSNADYGYHFVEVYDGIPTGTMASYSIRYDGTLLSASFTYGTLFSKQEDGTYAVMGEAAMISESEAIQIALEAVTPFAQERGEAPLEVESCELKAFKDELYYYVELTGPCNCGHAHDRSFYQEVDAYTGEPGALAVSK